MTEATSITALLGPTNTGKTHRAVERMLEHRSGVIGLPLRLLAREVYDRITTRVGEARVALLTGEEKRVPPRADYWICTVEAMPLEREFDFLAVDEIQLAAHDQRGHVFTDRLLRARGRKETWFLGSETMRPLVQQLLPTAQHATGTRLSRLSATGMEKLSRLPARTAVVAFSLPEVYAIAERLRAKRGGAAVVLGALSPRTRNAQVALFQSGEVDYLVATDAIGMGLNLDVGHVAFASLRKFDGRDARELDLAEIAQIAGRAGRHLRDGTFGTVAPLHLPEGVAAAVEAHRFPPVRHLIWRNADLDFASIDALGASLARKPHLRCLRLVTNAEDVAALELLARDPDVRARATSPETVELLWEVCRVPDFRKLLLETHVHLLGEIFAMLTSPRGLLDERWMDETIRGIDDPAGDLDTLTARLAAIRTWTYISHQARWLKDATRWQARTRAIEDRLSDALHERLVQRFVDRGARRAPAPSPSPGTRRGPRAVETDEAIIPSPSHPFAALARLRVARTPTKPSPELAGARGVEALVEASHDRIGVDPTGRLTFDERPIGRLARGSSLLLPDVRLGALDDLGEGARSRVLRRLLAFARDLVEDLLAPLRAPAMLGLSAAGRGVAYQLEQGLGTASARNAAPQLADLTDGDRALFAGQGVVLGQRVLYLPELLRPPALARRQALGAAWFDGPSRPVAPHASSVVSFRVRGDADPRAYAAIGFPVFGGRAIRADVAERASVMAAGDATPAALGSVLGCKALEIPGMLEALRPVA